MLRKPHSCSCPSSACPISHSLLKPNMACADFLYCSQLHYCSGVWLQLCTSACRATPDPDWYKGVCPLGGT